MPTPQNGQTHSNESSATADEFFKCNWPFCGVGPYSDKWPLEKVDAIACFCQQAPNRKKRQNHGVYLLMLGMSKAFDTVDVSIVFKYLNNIDNDELFLINIILDTQLEKQ